MEGAEDGTQDKNALNHGKQAAVLGLCDILNLVVLKILINPPKRDGVQHIQHRVAVCIPLRDQAKHHITLREAASLFVFRACGVCFKLGGCILRA